MVNENYRSNTPQTVKLQGIYLGSASVGISYIGNFGTLNTGL